MTDRHLFIAPQSLREAIMMQPMIALHRRANPEAKLDVVANQQVGPFLETIPQLDDVILISGEAAMRFRNIWQLAEVIRGRDYARSYNLDGGGWAALLPWMARIPTRQTVRNSDLKQEETLAELYYRLVCGGTTPGPATLPVPRLTAPVDAVQAIRTRLEQTFGAQPVSPAQTGSPLIVLAPGASGPAQQWPSRHFARLGAMLVKHWPAARIVFTGASAERSLCTEIATLSTVSTLNLAGQISASECVALLQAADAVVSNDSAMLHLSAACNNHLVAVYGATSPAANPPLTLSAQLHWLELTCSPCQATVCPLGHTNCLNLLEPVRVFNSIERMMQATDPSRPVN